MHFCLNKQEHVQLFDHLVDGKKVNDVELEAKIALSRGWEGELGIMNYIVTHLLMKRKASGKNCLQLLQTLYTLDTIMWVSIEEIDEEFVAFMLRHLSVHSNDLVEELIELEDRLLGFSYDRSLRY